MNTLRKIAKNTLFFFYFIYTARYLGADGFGILSLAISIASIFGILADLGFNTLITRELTRDNSKTIKYTKNIIKLNYY